MFKLPIIFKIDKEVFYLFCFLNLAGYDDEKNQQDMHPLRKIVRQKLKNVLKIERYLPLKRSLSKKHQGQFVIWLLWKKYGAGEPFNIFLRKDLPFFKKFEILFQKFINTEGEKLSWPKAKRFYSEEKGKHYQGIIKELNILMVTLNLDFGILKLNKIIIIPNFLDAHNRGYGPKIGKTAFIVYGPLENKNFNLIRHEFLHSAINPLIINNNIFLKKIEKISKNHPISALFKKIGYSNWPVIIEEHLVRALDIKTRQLNPREKIELLKQEKEKGFMYIENIFSNLKKGYKKNELLDILKDILDNIDKFINIIT